MFHVPAHKQQQPSQRPGQVPLPAPQPQRIVMDDAAWGITSHEDGRICEQGSGAVIVPPIVKRIADRKRATDLAVRDAIEYVRCCGYACERSPYPAHVFIYSYEYEHIDGVQQLVPKQHTVHHSKAIDFVNKLN